MAKQFPSERRGRLFTRIALSLIACSCVFSWPNAVQATEIPRTTVAVMPFNVEGSAFSPGQGQVMAELLTGELLATAQYTIVERVQLNKAAAELSLQAGGQVDPTTAAALGQKVGAQVVVVGTLAGEGNDKLVMGRFIDVGKGTVLAAKNLSAGSGSLLKVAGDLVGALVQSEEKLAVDLQKEARRQNKLGQTEAALDSYQKLTARYPRTSVAADAVLNLARFHLDEGDYFTAADYAESVLETYSDNPLTEEALFILAESKFFTVYGDPRRETDPRAFLETWRNKQSGQGADASESIRLKARLSQDAKQKYELLLAEFPATPHSTVVKERLAAINRHGGQ